MKLIAGITATFGALDRLPGAAGPGGSAVASDEGNKVSLAIYSASDIAAPGLFRRPSPAS